MFWFAGLLPVRVRCFTCVILLFLSSDNFSPPSREKTNSYGLINHDLSNFITIIVIISRNVFCGVMHSEFGVDLSEINTEDWNLYFIFLQFHLQLSVGKLHAREITIRHTCTDSRDDEGELENNFQSAPLSQQIP